MSDFSLFPNGTSLMVWMDSNCDRCWKGRVNEKTGRSRCAIENAIALASATNGKLDHNRKRIAERLHWDGKTYLEADCPERQETRPKTTANPKPISDLPLFK